MSIKHRLSLFIKIIAHAGHCKRRFLFPCLILICILVLQTGCKKLVEVDPPVTAVVGENVYGANTTAISVLNELYSRLSSTSFPDAVANSLSVWNGLMADELQLWEGSGNTAALGCYTNSLSASAPQVWAKFYNYIYTCNSVIEGVTRSVSLTPEVRDQLLGEAKFMRAFFYFNLVNLYGDVPLALITDYKVNAQLFRSSKQQVYQQMVDDLKDAQTLLSAQYKDVTLLNESAERTRPNRWAATALLARVYLYQENWDNAETEATALIQNTQLFDLAGVTLNEVFLANSKESIWQLQPVLRVFTNTQEGRVFIIPSSGPTEENPVFLNRFLLDSFETGDQRKIQWIDSIVVVVKEATSTEPAETKTYYFPYKYKINSTDVPVTEYTMMFRLGEQYLIRAEARAQKGNLTTALEDVNLVRQRAGLPDFITADKAALLAGILHERKMELFTESGHRWFDLKRTGLIDAVMNIITPLKGGSWNSYSQLYPIPLGEILKDKNLDQNPGY